MSIFSPNIEKLKIKKDINGLIEALQYKRCDLDKVKNDRVEGKYYQVYKNAAAALGELGDKHAVDPIIQALQDDTRRYGCKNWSFPAYTIYALEKLVDAHDERVIEPLIALFFNLGLRNWEVLSKVSGILTKIGRPSVQPLIDNLTKALSGELKYYDNTGLDYHIRTLSFLRGRESVPILLDCLQRGFGPGTTIVDALGDIGDERAINPLLSYLDQVDIFRSQSDLRYVDVDGRPFSVGRALAKIGGLAVKAVLSTMRKETGKKFWSLGVSLLHAGYSPEQLEVEDAVEYYLATRQWDKLVQIGEHSVTWKILLFLKDKELQDKDLSRQTRINIAKTLGMIESSKAIDALFTVLSDYYDGEDIRVACANALGKIGRPAINQLINFLNTSEPSDYADKVTPSVAGGIDWAPISSVGSFLRVKEAVLEALGQIGDEVAIEPICTYLSWIEGIAKNSEDSDNFNFIGHARSASVAIYSLESIFEKSHSTKNVQSTLTYWISYRNKEEKDYIVSIRSTAIRLYNLLGY